MQMLKKSGIAAAVAGAIVFGGLRFGAETSGAAPPEKHPHIHHALAELREARRELKEADHDFGGHRKEALEATDAAIRQLERALKFDR